MSARSRRRAARAAGLSEEARPRRPLQLRLPILPVLAVGSGLVLLGTAWTTRWPPGAPREETSASRFTFDIPPEHQRAINSWERFFICYDLIDPEVVATTLRANFRTTGSLDFPGDRVDIELPSAAARSTPRAEGGSEEEVIAAQQAIATAIRERSAQVRQQCIAGTGGQ